MALFHTTKNLPAAGAKLVAAYKSGDYAGVETIDAVAEGIGGANALREGGFFAGAEIGELANASPERLCEVIEAEADPEAFGAGADAAVSPLLALAIELLAKAILKRLGWLT